MSPETPCGHCNHPWSAHRPPDGAMALPWMEITPKLGPMCRAWNCRCEMFAEEAK